MQKEHRIIWGMTNLPAKVYALAPASSGVPFGSIAF